MIVQITDLLCRTNLDQLAAGQDQLILLSILALGSAVTGGMPMLSLSSFEFSLNRVFILSIFLLSPRNIILYFALGSIIAGTAIRWNSTTRELWRYIVSATVIILILKFGPGVYLSLRSGVPYQMMIISILPILILAEIIFGMIFSEKGSDPARLWGLVLISYIASIPLSLMAVIMILHNGILGAALAFAVLTGFSFAGRLINRKHRWNTRRILEITRQDKLAAHLMQSSSYIEFLHILQNSIFKESGNRAWALAKSSDTGDWVLWNSREKSSCAESDLISIIPSKGEFIENFTIKNIKGTALGIRDSKDLTILLSGPEKDVLSLMPSSLLGNFILLLGNTWEAVGHAVRSERSFLAAAVMLARLADSKDDYTHGHSLRVAGLSTSLGRNLNLSSSSIQTLRVAAILHDIGKLAIPASILTKRGLLTRKEREIVEAHPVEGARIVSGLSGYKEVSKIIRSHHERLDGNGYPDGLQNGDIPFMARIVAVADTFDAITSDRSYHSISGWESALEAIRAEKGSKFDSRIVTALESILSEEESSMA